MPDPIFTFAFIVATLMGAVFHLFVGGDAKRLASFLLASWLGFGLGHTLGISMGVTLFMIGELRMVTATIGAFFALFVASVLTGERSRQRPQR